MLINWFASSTSVVRIHLIQQLIQPQRQMYSKLGVDYLQPQHRREISVWSKYAQFLSTACSPPPPSSQGKAKHVRKMYVITETSCTMIVSFVYFLTNNSIIRNISNRMLKLKLKTLVSNRVIVDDFLFETDVHE